jgi:hypothetical protein
VDESNETRFFSTLDESMLSAFQIEALAAVRSTLSSHRFPVALPTAEFDSKTRMVWLRIPNRNRPEYTLETVLELETFVINLGPHHEHFGYDDGPTLGSGSTIENAVEFLQAALDGRIEIDLLLRGRTVVKTSLYIIDENGKRGYGSHEGNILMILLAPFLRKNRLTERIALGEDPRSGSPEARP